MRFRLVDSFQPRRIKESLVGKKVYIKSPDSWANGEWGIVYGEDGRDVYVGIAGDKNSQLLFDRKEIKIMKELPKNESISLKESLGELLNGEAFITDSSYQVRDLLMNKPKPYRILYDSNIDSYMICDANDWIHHDMLEDAFKRGYYLKAGKDPKIDEKVRGYINNFLHHYHSYIYNYADLGHDGYYWTVDENENEIEKDIGQYLLYIVFVPSGVDEEDVAYSPSSDGYDEEYYYTFGTIYTRDADSDIIDKCELFNILSKYRVQ